VHALKGMSMYSRPASHPPHCDPHPPLAVCGTAHPLTTEAPTASPTANPSASPTESPTTKAPPTKAPVEACAAGTTFWLHDPVTNRPIRKLANNTAMCLAHPYNVEVRPCGDSAPSGVALLARPAHIRLVDTTRGRPVLVHKSPPQSSPPLYLFGQGAATSPGPLPNGVYHVSAKGGAAADWGRLVFRQSCRCPKGRKGKKGCRNQRA
jgi:hypothetical protein